VNFDPTANANPNQAYYSSLLSKKTVLGPLTGNGITTIKSEFSTEEISGQKWLAVADNYSAPTSGASAPANNWYWFIGSNSFNNNVSGVGVSVDLDIVVEFYEIATPAV
jgi:hypothetical protein